MKTRILLLVSSLLACGLANAQGDNDYVAPRTEWGQPDLQFRQKC